MDTTYRKKDIVLYRTNQPQVHVQEMFGHEVFNPSDTKPEEYIGWVKDVISENEYLIASISPLKDFVCLANAEDIIRKMTDEELTDKQKEIREFYMPPNPYRNDPGSPEIAQLDCIEKKCLTIAIRALAERFPKSTERHEKYRIQASQLVYETNLL